MKLKSLLYLAALLSMIPLGNTGCATNESATPAANYLFPRLKYTSEANFSLTKAERRVALQELRRMNGDALYEVVAAQDGCIVRIRPVKSLPGSDSEYYTLGFMHRLQARKLKPNHMSAPYRTFFFPMTVKRTTEFLGTQGFID